MCRTFPALISAIAVFVSLMASSYASGLKDSLYYDVFGLDGSDTVADFNSSSHDAAVHWLLNACDDGECLLPIDWYCGFSNGDSDVMRECILDEIDRAVPYLTLDVIRKWCGRKHMKFIGNVHSSMDQCRENDGVWGELN